MSSKLCVESESAPAPAPDTLAAACVSLNTKAFIVFVESVKEINDGSLRTHNKSSFDSKSTRTKGRERKAYMDIR